MPKILVLPIGLFYLAVAPAPDAVTVDPEHHKVEFENDQLRVVRSTYPAGYETPLHDHLPGISITTKDRMWEAVYQGPPHRQRSW
jgi:hypothetical protein